MVGRGRGGRCGRRRRRVAPGKVKVASRGELVVVAVAVVAVGADAAVAVGEGGGVPVVDDGVHGHGDLKSRCLPQLTAIANKIAKMRGETMGRDNGASAVKFSFLSSYDKDGMMLLTQRSNTNKPRTRMPRDSFSNYSMGWATVSKSLN